MSRVALFSLAIAALLAMGLLAPTASLAAEAPEVPLVLRPDARARLQPDRPATTLLQPSPTRARPFTRWDPIAAHVAVHTGTALALTGTVAALLIAAGQGYWGGAGLLPTVVIAFTALPVGGTLAALPYLRRPALLTPALVGLGSLGVIATIWAIQEFDTFALLGGMLFVGPVAGAAFLTQVVVSEAHLPWRITPSVGRDRVGLQISGRF